MSVSTLSLTLFALSIGQAAPAEVSSTPGISSHVHMVPSLVDSRSKLAAQLDLMHYQQQQLSYAIEQQAAQALRAIALQFSTSAQSADETSATLAQSTLLQSRAE